MSVRDFVLDAMTTLALKWYQKPPVIQIPLYPITIKVGLKYVLIEETGAISGDYEYFVNFCRTGLTSEHDLAYRIQLFLLKCEWERYRGFVAFNLANTPNPHDEEESDAQPTNGELKNALPTTPAETIKTQDGETVEVRRRHFDAMNFRGKKLRAE